MKINLTEKDKEFIKKIESYKDLNEKIKACKRYINYLNREIENLNTQEQATIATIENLYNEIKIITKKNDPSDDKSFEILLQKFNETEYEKFKIENQIKEYNDKIKIIEKKITKLEKKSNSHTSKKKQK